MRCRRASPPPKSEPQWTSSGLSRGPARRMISATSWRAKRRSSRRWPSEPIFASIDRERGEPMARRGSSFGFMGMFGRSHDLRQLDQALRSVDVHPAVVPEAVKLTTVNLLKDHAGDDDPVPDAYRAAAEIVGYCMVGADIFAGANAAEGVLAVERRIGAALQSGGSIDAHVRQLT